MDLRKIIREEMDEWEWAKEIEAYIPITELSPNTKYKIVKLEGQAYEEYIGGNLKHVDPYNKVFIIDSEGGFAELYGENYDYYKEGVDYVWVQIENGPGIGDWIPIDTIMVTTFI